MTLIWQFLSASESFFAHTHQTKKVKITWELLSCLLSRNLHFQWVLSYLTQQAPIEITILIRTNC